MTGVLLLLLLLQCVEVVGLLHLGGLGHLAGVLLRALLKHTHAQTVLLARALLLCLIEALTVNCITISKARHRLLTLSTNLPLSHLLVIEAAHIARVLRELLHLLLHCCALHCRACCLLLEIAESRLGG